MKRVIITGCSRGIGLVILKELMLKNDFEIVGTSTSGRHTLHSNHFKCLLLNLGDNDSIETFVEQIQNIEFDFLINNAGILLEQWDVAQINFQQLEETFRVNLFGTIRLTESLIPQLKKGGHIINVTSGWGSFSEKNFNEFQPHYKMSKAALNMYTKLLSERLKNKHITVSSFDPGWVQTDMGGKNANRTTKEVALDLIALMQNDVESGKFWHKREIRDW